MFRFLQLALENFKGWDFLVPFQECTSRPPTLERLPIEVPYLRANRLVMRIEQIVAVVLVARKVIFHNRVRRQRIEIGVSVPTMVTTTHENIIEINEEAATGAHTELP